MVDADSPPQQDREPDGPTVRWWFPALFGISLAAAVIAIFAWLNRADSTAPLDTVPDLSSLGGDAPAVDDPAPDFTVTPFDGAPFSLAEHLATDGRPVVLNLWASWCAPCRAEMPAFDEAAALNPDVVFIGVAVQDSEADAAAFAEEIGVSYLLAFDEGDVVVDAYPALGLPATFFIGTDGGIAERHFGPLTVESMQTEIDAAFGS